jgi:non-haem Fe2+, alpha-ketoglutarate-dependent halogenase
MKALTEAQLAAWRHNGFLSPFPLLGAQELAACQDALARFERWLGAPVNHAMEGNWRSMGYLALPWVASLAQDPRILDIVEDMIGPDILIYTSTFFIKDAGTPTIAAWHQDSAYYGLTPEDELTVWIALTDADETAGCMETLSFQGQPRLMQHVAKVVENSVNRASQKILEPLDDDRAVAMPLQAGQFSIHHGLCPHRSGPNRSSHRRVGLGLNFIAPHVRGKLPEKPCAVLVRGEDRFGHFDLLSFAKAELDADSVANQRHGMRVYHTNYAAEEARHANRFVAHTNAI